MPSIRSNWKRKKASDGQPLCLVCGVPLTGRRTSYCSDEHRIINNPGLMRQQVWERDRGVCALCGLDTKTLARRKSLGIMSHIHWHADHIVPVSEGGGMCGIEGYRTLCVKCHGIESGRLRKRLKERQAAQKAGKLFL